MNDKKLPTGAQFSPGQINLREVLKLAKSFENQETNKFISALVDKKIFNKISVANNCPHSMSSYKILNLEGTLHFTDFGNSLIASKDDAELYDLLSRHILKELNGMLLIESIRDLNRSGVKITNETVYAELANRDFEYTASGNNVPPMKLWLEKSGVLNKWTVDENKVKELVELSEGEFDAIKSLKLDQYYFLRTLCNTGKADYQNATDIRDLTEGSFPIKLPRKGFAQAIIKPLEEKGFIESKKANGKSTGNSSNVKITDLTKKEMIIPYLKQIEDMVGKEVALYHKKTLAELNKAINLKDKYKKGIALEAFAIKIMDIIGLEYFDTRLKGNQTGGAEVDVIFHSSQLLFSRWQVQCKNTKKVSLEYVAKEVGLAQVLKTNAIVIMTTGSVSETARQYATKVMKDTNLCIMFITGIDIDKIIEKPTEIVKIFNRESLAAKNIKILSPNLVKELDE